MQRLDSKVSVIFHYANVVVAFVPSLI